MWVTRGSSVCETSRHRFRPNASRNLQSHPQIVECATLSAGLRSTLLVRSVNMKTVRTTWQIFILTHFYFISFQCCVVVYTFSLSSTLTLALSSLPSAFLLLTLFASPPFTTRLQLDCQDTASSELGCLIFRKRF